MGCVTSGMNCNFSLRMFHRVRISVLTKVYIRKLHLLYNWKTMLRNGGGILFPSIILSRALHVKIHIYSATLDENLMQIRRKRFIADLCKFLQIPPPIFAQKFAKELYLSSYNQSFPKIDKNVSPTRN